MVIRFNIYVVVVSEVEFDNLDDMSPESVQLDYTTPTAFVHAKGKSKDKGKSGKKSEARSFVISSL